MPDLLRPIWQAKITESRDRWHAWKIIHDAPDEYREQLIRHARTVFRLRDFYDRKAKRGHR